MNEVRATPGWERVRVQIDVEAIDAVGPQEIAKAFEMKETVMSKRAMIRRSKRQEYYKLWRTSWATPTMERV